MKVELNKLEVQFIPFSINIKFQSPSEAQAVYSLFNVFKLTEAMDKFGVNHKAIRCVIKEGFPRIDNCTASEEWQEINRVLK